MICNTQQRVLIANRGEIAARILRAVETLGGEAVAARASDEQPGPYFTRAHANCTLPGSGVQAYLDADALIEAARNTGATMVHPGYSFLSESTESARACADAGLAFIGPSPEALELLGDLPIF